MDLIVHGKKSETCAQIEPQVSKPKWRGQGFLNAAPTSNKGVQGSANTPSVGNLDPQDPHVFGPPGSGFTSQRY